MIGTELRPRVLQTGFCAPASYLFGTFNLGVWVSGFKLWGDGIDRDATDNTWGLGL